MLLTRACFANEWSLKWNGITSKDNEKIKWLIKLQNSRKARQESESFVAVGDAAGAEVLRCGLPLQQVFASDERR